ncbi:MAG: extracellular solute-binding protein [Acetobacteraceae bacterium]
MRQRLLLIVCALAWIALPAASRADTQALYEAAKKEAPMTWYISFYGGDIPAKTAAAFGAKYPGLMVNPVRMTSGAIFQRLNQDLRSRVPVASVYTSSIGGQYDLLVKDGVLAQYTPEAAAALNDNVKAAIVPGYVYPIGTGLMTLAYNTAKIKAADAPKSWKDMLDPKWKGQIAVGDPAFSGFDAVLAVAITKIYGWQFYEALAKNNPLVQRSTFDTLTALNSGERSIGVMSDTQAIDSGTKGNPVAPIYPADGTVMILGMTAVLKDAPQPNTARLFTEFLLGPEHGRIMIENHYQSARADAVNELGGGKRLSDIPLAPVMTSTDFVQALPDLIERWRDLFSR